MSCPLAVPLFPGQKDVKEWHSVHSVEEELKAMPQNHRKTNFKGRNSIGSSETKAYGMAKGPLEATGSLLVGVTQQRKGSRVLGKEDAVFQERQ